MLAFRKVILGQIRNAFGNQNLTLQKNDLNLPSRTLFIKPDPNFEPNMIDRDVISHYVRNADSTGEYSPGGVNDTYEARKNLMDLLPKDRSELPPRRMKDSFTSAVVPLSTNGDLRNRYVTHCGNVRVGRLLEDMDVFAVWICMKHIKNPKSEGKGNPYSIVTGLVDSIHLPSEGDILTHEDIRMSGHISWVGTTSLEASIQLDQKDTNGQCKKITEAVFLLVARNPINEGSALVNPLVADTPEEEAFLKKGFERNLRRKLVMQESLIRKPPNVEERDIVHKIFMSTMNPEYAGWKTPKLPSNSRAMQHTILNTLNLCHPQYRNRYNKIFGGFIMRQALELAYANAFLYSRERPRLLDIDDISFKKPVEIGSLLGFRAMIGYVEGNYIHIPVMAEVIHGETGEKDVTNIFQFTFISNLSGKNPIPAVIPNTYQEAMTYLQSRRHFKDMMAETNRV